MHILFEMPSGIAILKKSEEETEKPVFCVRVCYQDQQEAYENIKKLQKGEVSPVLIKAIEESKLQEMKDEELLVADKRLSEKISEMFKIKTKVGDHTNPIFKIIRQEACDKYGEEMWRSRNTVSVSHLLSKDVLKVNSDKIDSMVIQSYSIYEEMEKEINNHIMRLKEWYSFHFPEMVAIMEENEEFLKTVQIVKTRANLEDENVKEELHKFLGEEKAEKIIRLAQISIGSEIQEEDMKIIEEDIKATQELTKSRKEIGEYLHEKMAILAPNVQAMVGDSIGAKLISYAGSIISLAKKPASTIQILGAEKSMFKAVKTKHKTPKYGIIYQTSLVGKASVENKGKIARTLAAKLGICSRVDAFSKIPDSSCGREFLVKLERYLEQMESQRKSSDKKMGVKRNSVSLKEGKKS